MLTVPYPLFVSAARDDDSMPWRTSNPGGPRKTQALSPTDAQLLERLRADDVSALTTLMQEHTPALVGIARLIVLDSDLAQDVVQDVFVTLWTRRSELLVSGTLGGYLARAVRNRAISVQRHERAEHRAGEVIALQLPELPNDRSTDIEVRELSIAVRRALDALPARCREIFLMNRSAGLPYAAIAEALGITVETVHTQMYRATKKLVEAIRAVG